MNCAFILPLMKLLLSISRCEGERENCILLTHCDHIQHTWNRRMHCKMIYLFSLVSVTTIILLSNYSFQMSVNSTLICYFCWELDSNKNVCLETNFSSTFFCDTINWTFRDLELNMNNAAQVKTGALCVFKFVTKHTCTFFLSHAHTYWVWDKRFYIYNIKCSFVSKC